LGCREALQKKRKFVTLLKTVGNFEKRELTSSKDLTELLNIENSDK